MFVCKFSMQNLNHPNRLSPKNLHLFFIKREKNSYLCYFITGMRILFYLLFLVTLY